MRLQEINNVDSMSVNGYTFDEWFSEIRAIIVTMNTGKDYGKYPHWGAHWRLGKLPEVAVTRWMTSVGSSAAGDGQ